MGDGEAQPGVTAELVMERFRLLERIGSGGMGVVYRAFDERLQREVAVKEIERARPERVLREAQAAARLNHPAIATLYELGEREGRAVLVSELVQGGTLDELARNGELTDRDVAQAGADLAEALAHAHERGVVHRDVKPQNVMVRPAGSGGRRAKLMDFGIASVAGAPTLTATGEVVGTLAYMAPEQAEGEAVGPPADVYSLALTLYEAWTGSNPVAGATPAQTARRIGLPVPSLAEYRPDLPEGLIELIDASLSADPLERPGAAELAQSLRAHVPDLDDEYALPAAEGPGERRSARGLVRVAALVGAAACVAVLAGPAGLGGLALLLAVVLAPGRILCRNPLAALLTPAAIPLGAVGALSAVPALIAACAGRTPARAAVGGASFWAYLLGASILGAGPRAGLLASAPSGWASEPGTAAHELLLPLLAPQALAGAALFAAAATALGLILRLHPALALVAAMIWAGGLAAALAALGNGALGEQTLAAVVAAAGAVAWEARRRGREDGPSQPLATSPLHGGA
jgi:tRNA A-37 threonylcarbamoyl transferase component Bud32